MITVHTIVKNEDRFIKPVLSALLKFPEIQRILVWDTGSKDKTIEKILSIHDPRIVFEEKGGVDRKGLVVLRNEQITRTKTEWILLVDGDEIWPKENLRALIVAMKRCSRPTIALVNRTRNVVGNLSHYLPDSKGHYRIGPWKGHLNIRAIRHHVGLQVKGVYPNEWYELDGMKIQDQVDRLAFVDTWYIHATHLRRSGHWFAELLTIDRLKKRKLLYGVRDGKLLKM